MQMGVGDGEEELLFCNNGFPTRILSPHNDTTRHEYQEHRIVQRQRTRSGVPQERRSGADGCGGGGRARDYAAGGSFTSCAGSRAWRSRTEENRRSVRRLVDAGLLLRFRIGVEAVSRRPPDYRSRTYRFLLDKPSLLHFLEFAVGGLLSHTHHFSELRSRNNRVGTLNHLPEVLYITIPVLDSRHSPGYSFHTAKYRGISHVSHLPTVTKQLYGSPHDSAKHDSHKWIGAPQNERAEPGPAGPTLLGVSGETMQDNELDTHSYWGPIVEGEAAYHTPKMGVAA